MTPRHGSIIYLLNGAFRTMAFLAWGDPRNRAVVCVHGLTRNARDFDALAETLAADFYVVCPDLPGRGQSEWLDDPALYQPLSYLQALAHLLAVLDREVAWVGTSLGGICGMLVASMPGQPIRRLLLNDVGPFIPQAAVARIRDYVGETMEFADPAALEAFLRRVLAPFGKLSDAQWAHLARYSGKTLPDGRVRLRYDPAIATSFRTAEPADVDLWAVWAKIAIPRLVIRGESSDLLLPETYDRMVASGAQGFVVGDAGHAPALMDAPTMAAIRGFLES